MNFSTITKNYQTLVSFFVVELVQTSGKESSLVLQSFDTLSLGNAAPSCALRTTQ